MSDLSAGSSHRYDDLLSSSFLVSTASVSLR